MLGAFFGTPYRNWWLDYASDPECMSSYSSHWLVRKTAAREFAQGRVRLDRLQGSMLEVRRCSHTPLFTSLLLILFKVRGQLLYHWIG
jgi:hypothetical protein